MLLLLYVVQITMRIHEPIAANEGMSGGMFMEVVGKLFIKK